MRPPTQGAYITASKTIKDQDCPYLCHGETKKEEMLIVLVAVVVERFLGGGLLMIAVVVVTVTMVSKVLMTTVR